MRVTSRNPGLLLLLAGVAAAAPVAVGNVPDGVAVTG